MRSSNDRSKSAGPRGHIGESEEIAHMLRHPNWQRLARLCRKRRYLTLTLHVAEGLPVSAEEALAKLRFDQD
jgi:hypothetical protein